MRIRTFDYWAAPSLNDALNELERHGSDATVIAGGTDLVVNMKRKQILPRRVISLHNLVDLDFVQKQNSTVRIGALARHADLAANQELIRHFPILCQAVGLIGSWQIRNVGTIGGNICNASPAADSVPPLMVLDAQLILASKSTDKKIPINSFFAGPGETTMGHGQILKEIEIKLPMQRSAGCYLKLRRRKAVDVSVAGMAFQAEIASDERTLARVAIALGGVAPTPIRVPEAEAILTGLSLNEAMTKIPECARIASNAASPIDDIRASAEYRRLIIETYVRMGAEKIINTLKNGGGSIT
jgi:carbon-monoxide dehydrogenase medium subunit